MIDFDSLELLRDLARIGFVFCLGHLAGWLHHGCYGAAKRSASVHGRETRSAREREAATP